MPEEILDFVLCEGRNLKVLQDCIHLTSVVCEAALLDAPLLYEIENRGLEVLPVSASLADTMSSTIHHEFPSIFGLHDIVDSLTFSSFGSDVDD